MSVIRTMPLVCWENRSDKVWIVIRAGNGLVPWWRDFLLFWGGVVVTNSVQEMLEEGRNARANTFSSFLFKPHGVLVQVCCLANTTLTKGEKRVHED